MTFIEKFYLPQNQTALMGALADAGYSAQSIAKLEWKDFRSNYFAVGMRKKRLSASLGDTIRKARRLRWHSKANKAGKVYAGLEIFRFVFYVELPSVNRDGRRYTTDEVRHILSNRLPVENLPKL